MPLYEYKCADCERPFELLVASPALADAVACRYCGSRGVRRLVSAFASASRSSAEPVTAAAPRAGGCCGGSCGCGH